MVSTEILSETNRVEKMNITEKAVDAEKPSSDEKAENVEPQKTSTTLMAEGRRDFLCNDMENSVACLSEACELLTIEFGPQALETAMGYFWYGKALWELCRNSNDFLGTKAENENVEADDDKSEDKPVEEMSSTPLTKSDNNENEPPVETETIEGETNEEEDPEEENSEEDVGDAQLAYEMFELARSIYQAVEKPDDDTRCKTAECYLLLGEVNAENGQLEETVKEYNSALEIFRDVYTDDHRRTAEVYFSLGCAHDAIYQFKKSKECFQKAIAGLENRVKTLQDKKDKEGELKYVDKKELATIQESVLPEMKERLEDAVESEKKHEQDKEMLKQVLLNKSTTNAFDTVPQASTSTSAPVQSINHLIKRKRKSNAETDTSPRKSLKTDE